MTHIDRSPARHFPAHVATLMQRSIAALESGEFDHLLIASGRPRYRFLDDAAGPFVSNPHFRHWLPLTELSDSWLLITPGSKPRLIYHQPRDFWHLPPPDPEGFWLSHFDVECIAEPGQARALLPADPARCAIIGETVWALEDIVPNNPQEVLNRLHYDRAIKTDYELDCMRLGSRAAARSHRAAEMAFRAGESEYGIHLAFCQASRQTEKELPYSSIVGVNEHAAVLHYQHLRREPAAENRSLLIDAGITHSGYATDVTRTYAAQAGEFGELIQALDMAQQRMVAATVAGKSYPELHLDAHRMIAEVLLDSDLVTGDADMLVESGITRAFFPHGLGHFLGLQVHDVGGFMASPSGQTLPRPDGHPFLRLTRTLQPGHVVTIEPGIYFIDMLLEPLRDSAAGRSVNWNKVAELHPCGGIRIEDDVHVSAEGPENLTRDAFALLQ